MIVFDFFLNNIVPYLIKILEIIGIIVVFWSGIHGFWQYLFMKKKFDPQYNLAKGMALGLEFKMAAEILRTVLIKSMDELYMLGAVILLRALLSLLIHFEISPRRSANSSADAKKAPGNSAGDSD